MERIALALRSRVDHEVNEDDYARRCLNARKIRILTIRFIDDKLYDVVSKFAGVAQW